jgi:hypothetical protein
MTLKSPEAPVVIFLFQDTKQPTETRFLLSDQLYAKASIPPTEKVCLWLGVSA